MWRTALSGTLHTWYIIYIIYLASDIRSRNNITTTACLLCTACLPACYDHWEQPSLLGQLRQYSIRHTRAGPAKKRTMFPNSECSINTVASAVLRVGAWKLEALTLTQHCTCRKNTMKKSKGISFSDSTSPRYPRKLLSTSFSTLNSYENCCSLSRRDWRRQCCRHKENIDIRRVYAYKYVYENTFPNPKIVNSLLVSVLKCVRTTY